MDPVAATKAFHLLPRTLCRGFDVPPGLVGANEIRLTLCANPLAGEWVVLKVFEVGFGRPRLIGVDDGGEKGEPRREVVRGGGVRNAQLVGQVIPGVVRGG